MIPRLAFLYPEMVMFAGTCVIMVLGLSRTFKARKACAPVAAASVVLAGFLAFVSTPRTGGEAQCPISGYVYAQAVTAEAGQLLLPDMVRFAKVVIAAVGLLLLLPLAGTVDRGDEGAIAAGRRAFDPLRSNRAEFYAFYLFSLTGLMLCAGADNLIWLFLALELTSLPTYIMVAVSTARNRGREAAVKYFFLGALGAAVFLYGFVLIYGGTGTTRLNDIAAAIHLYGLNTLTLAGVVLSLLGLAFKIAAVPMHFYTPDVYEGAAPQVSGFLAFVPKTAGFLAILLLCATVGWVYPAGQAGVGSLLASSTPQPLLPGTGDRLPYVVWLLLWVVSVLTMTVGNVLALRQQSVKRVLAYSSIAHSGYMLVGVVAGPGEASSQSGVTAVLFYLLSYGVMSAGTFAALAAVERSPGPDGEPREVETFDDLRGLCASHPVAGWTMVVCSLSLLGLPPLLGFFGKLPLFTSGIAAGQVTLVVILGLNSAIAAVYYLRLAFTPLLESPEQGAEPVSASPFRSRMLGGLASAAGVLVLSVLGGQALGWAHRAAVPGTIEHAPAPKKSAGSPAPRLDGNAQADVNEPAPAGH
jgi:NADH-quinone oxidoreductase subunit N